MHRLSAHGPHKRLSSVHSLQAFVPERKHVASPLHCPRQLARRPCCCCCCSMCAGHIDWHLAAGLGLIFEEAFPPYPYFSSSGGGKHRHHHHSHRRQWSQEEDDA